MEANNPESQSVSDGACDRSSQCALIRPCDWLGGHSDCSLPSYAETEYSTAIQVKMKASNQGFRDKSTFDCFLSMKLETEAKIHFKCQSFFLLIMPI